MFKARQLLFARAQARRLAAAPAQKAAAAEEPVMEGRRVPAPDRLMSTPGAARSGFTAPVRVKPRLEWR